MNQDAEQAAKLFIFEINENENIQVTWDVFLYYIVFTLLELLTRFKISLLKVIVQTTQR